MGNDKRLIIDVPANCTLNWGPASEAALTRRARDIFEAGGSTCTFRIDGKPVVVGADPKGGTGRGVVSAASYEARDYGIHSAMPIGQAYRQCPDGIFLPVRMERYHEISGRIFAIFSRYTDLVEPLSVDEAFLDLSGFSNLTEYCREIKTIVERDTGIPVSIGIGPTKTLAKIANHIAKHSQKAQGVVDLTSRKLQDKALGMVKVKDIWGVGSASASKLHSLLK